MKEENNNINVVETKDAESLIHLLVTAPTHFMNDIGREIEAKYKVTYAYGASYEELLDLVDTIDAWIVDPGANYKVNKKILNQSKQLKMV